AAALIGRLGWRVGGPPLGLMAGVVLEVLPVTSRDAQEVGANAFVAFSAVAAAQGLVGVVAPRGTPGGRGLYVPASAAPGLRHVLARAVLVAHGFVVLAVRPRLFGRWLLAAVVGVLPSVPIYMYGYEQRDLISWIYDDATQRPLVFVEQYFGAA